MPSDPPSGETLLDVAQITKPHGLLGEVVVHLWSDRTERLAPGTTLQGPSGPLQIRSARPHSGHYLVVFEGVVDREGADRLRGAVLQAPATDDPDTLWVHQLVGARVVGADGSELGTVSAVEANPASDLLVLESGGLIPVRFVTAHVPGEQVTVDIPEGLLD